MPAPAHSCPSMPTQLPLPLALLSQTQQSSRSPSGFPFLLPLAVASTEAIFPLPQSPDWPSTNTSSSYISAWICCERPTPTRVLFSPGENNGQSGVIKVGTLRTKVVQSVYNAKYLLCEDTKRESFTCQIPDASSIFKIHCSIMCT